QGRPRGGLPGRDPARDVGDPRQGRDLRRDQEVPRQGPLRAVSFFNAEIAEVAEIAEERKGLRKTIEGSRAITRARAHRRFPDPAFIASVSSSSSALSAHLCVLCVEEATRP